MAIIVFSDSTTSYWQHALQIFPLKYCVIVYVNSRCYCIIIIVFFCNPVSNDKRAADVASHVFSQRRYAEGPDGTVVLISRYHRSTVSDFPLIF